MSDLREIFVKWSKAALSLPVMGGFFLIVLGPRFIGWWIGPSFEHPAGEVLQILMVSSLVFLPVRGVAVPVLMGLGKPTVPAMAYLAAGLLNLGLSVLLIRPLGLSGVALGTAIPNVLFALVVVTVACRELEISLPHYLRYVVPRAAVGALPVIPLLPWVTLGLEVQSMTGLIAAGAANVVLFGGVLGCFVYAHHPHVRLWTP